MIPFDKDKARKRFYDENPQYLKKSVPVRKITEEDILKVVELYIK